MRRTTARGDKLTRRSAVAALAAAASPPGAGATHRTHNLETGSAYCQAHEVIGPTRLLFVSGQVPADEEGNVPRDFKDQARLAWSNVRRQLAAAGMTLDDLAKVTIFLSDRRYRGDNAAVRKEVLGDLAPALTIVITGIYDESWLLEIEAVGAV
jgi:enamine deaminase RidA (YjgF/YER057c/UK114 family)